MSNISMNRKGSKGIASKGGARVQVQKQKGKPFPEERFICTMGNEGLAGTVDIKTGNWGLVREALTARSTGPHVFDNGAQETVLSHGTAPLC